MAKTKRFASRSRSTIAQIEVNAPVINQSALNGSTHTEFVAPSGPYTPLEIQNQPSTQLENQNPQTTLPTNQNQSTHPINQNSQSISKRKSNKYWTIDLIDEEGIVKEARLKVQDVFVLPTGKKVVLEWNQEGQPVGEAAGLLGGYLGSIASNFNNFPISYEKWPKVPATYKEHVWTYTIKGKFQVNDGHHKKYIIASIGKKWKDNRGRLFAEHYNPGFSWEANVELQPEGIPREQWASFLSYRLSSKTMEMSEKNTANRQKQTMPHTLGSKTIARKKRELEIETGKSYDRGDMFPISHKRKDGSFVSDEARQKSEQLEMQMDGISSKNDAYTNIFGKEHPGRVRGMGFGVCPSQVYGPTCHHGSSTSSSSTTISIDQYNELKSELKASNERWKALEEQLVMFMQNNRNQFTSDFPNLRVSQVMDLSSSLEPRPSSSASHEPQNHGPSNSHFIS